MARGNQRDKAREKTQKEQASQVCIPEFSWILTPTFPCPFRLCLRASNLLLLLQKKKNTMSGTEFAKEREKVAAIMRQKQEAGMLER